MKLNNNEKRVLEILREDPYINQKDIASRISVSRPAVANIISSLQDKGYILGKPYLLREDSYITCIGGANFDVTLRMQDELVGKTSNPVGSSKSYGGVVRNVAENISRMGLNVSLMALLGDDSFGNELISSSNNLMETFASERVSNETTGTYYSVINQKGDMLYGFADMEINRLMDRSWILKHKKHIIMSEYLICDLNPSSQAIEALFELKGELDIPMAIVGVSGPKMKNLPKDIKGLDMIICNMDESQAYFNTSTENGHELCQLWLDAGVKKAVVTAGTKGSFYGQENKVAHQKPYLVKADKIVDVTGAGDAFSSALLYGVIKGETLEKSVKLGTANSSLTIQAPFAVNPNLSIKKLEKELEKYES
jgi:sugar/nucleoside kinase (ribokinase family)/DNA-binding CsgD family transcriptional regulator